MDEYQISYEEIDKEIEERAHKKREKLPHDIFDFVEFFVIALAVILLIFTFLIRQTVVTGGSMLPTLENGDRLIISNFFYTPKAGDIVVIQIEDEVAEKRPLVLAKDSSIIKRVIATAGQTVRIQNGVVYVDGAPLETDFDFWADSANMAEITVSDGHIFVMGDNRTISLDSRALGEIDERTVIGKVLFRIAPLSEFGGVD
jgi:signal peptidase I